MGLAFTEGTMAKAKAPDRSPPYTASDKVSTRVLGPLGRVPRLGGSETAGSDDATWTAEGTGMEAILARPPRGAVRAEVESAFPIRQVYTIEIKSQY